MCANSNLHDYIKLLKGKCASFISNVSIAIEEILNVNQIYFLIVKEFTVIMNSSCQALLWFWLFLPCSCQDGGRWRSEVREEEMDPLLWERHLYHVSGGAQRVWPGSGRVRQWGETFVRIGLFFDRVSSLIRHLKMLINI